MITLLIELGMNGYQARSYHPCRLYRPFTPTQLGVIGSPLFSDSDQIPQYNETIQWAIDRHQTMSADTRLSLRSL